MNPNGVRKPEQIKLIMECRQSGLSDYQWCQNQGINPGMFYNWVSKLRKAGYTNLDSESKTYRVPMISYFHQLLTKRKFVAEDELCEASHNSSDWVTGSESSSCFIRSTKGTKYLSEHLIIQFDMVCLDIFTPLRWNSCSIL